MSHCVSTLLLIFLTVSIKFGLRSCQTPLLFRPHPCSNEGPSHGLQSFRINLYHGLFTGCSVDICSDVFSLWASRKYPLHPSLLKLPQAAEEYPLEVLPPPPSSLTLESQDCFSHFVYFSSLLTHCCVAFCPFLNMFTQRHHQLHRWAQLCPVVGPLQSCCAWHRAGLVSSRRSHPCIFPATKALLSTPNTII